MTYDNNFQRYFDLLALSLDLKDNDKWFRGDNKQNYNLLFSTYIEMLKQDKDDFFISSSQKEKFIHSLNRSRDFYACNSEEELLELFQTMTSDDPTSFTILPISYLTEEPELSSSKVIDMHVSGLVVFKEQNSYKIILIDKHKMLNGYPVSLVTIPSEKMPSLCKQILLNEGPITYSKNEFLNMKSFEILYTIINHSTSDKPIPLDFRMGLQKKANDSVCQIEAALKISLYHNKKNIFTLEAPLEKESNNNPFSLEDDEGDSHFPLKIEWNDNDRYSTLNMRKRLLSAIKKLSISSEKLNEIETSKYFDHCFTYYLKRKTRKMDQKERIEVLDDSPMPNITFKADPFVQAILYGELSKEMMNSRIDKKNFNELKKHIPNSAPPLKNTLKRETLTR